MNLKEEKSHNVLLSDHNEMKLEINNRIKNEKLTSTWKLNNILRNNLRVKEEIKKLENILG